MKNILYTRLFILLIHYVNREYNNNKTYKSIGLQWGFYIIYNMHYINIIQNLNKLLRKNVD